MVRYTNLPDNKNKPFGGAYSVYDSDTLYMRDYLVQKYAVHTMILKVLNKTILVSLNIFYLTPIN